MSVDNYKTKAEKSKAQKARKKGRLRFLLKLIGGSILTALIGLIIVAALFEKQIAEMVIGALNKQLKTELHVSEASLSLIWKFPQAAVYLNDAQIEGTGGQEEKLLDVGSISLQCSTLGLLMGNYNFTSIAINNGALFIYSDKKGNVNYDIFKPSEKATTSESTDLNLSISNATLSNVAIHYVDEASSYDIKVKAKSAYFEGDFIIDNVLNENKHTMTSYAELYSEYITVGETTYMKGTDLAYDGAVDLDLAAEIYSFERIKLYIQGNEFKVNGSIAKAEKGTEYNMVFDSENALLGSLLQLIPEQFAATLGQFQSNGKLSFDARINGIATKRNAPIIEVKFGLKDGRITHPNMEGSMKNVNFDVHFTNGNGIDDQTAKLNLIDFQAHLNNQPINLSWEMIGLENPTINMGLDGKIPLNAVYGFFGEQVTEGNGWLDIAKLSLKGRLKDMISMYRIPRVQLDGLINFEQAYLLVNDIPATIESGQLSLENNTFNVSNVTLKTSESDAVLNGEFHNVLPVLLSDSLNSQNAKLTFQASLHAQKMDVDELLAIGSGHSTEEIEAAPLAEQDSLTKETYESREHRTSFLKGSFITNIVNFKYGNVLAQNFNGEVEFNNSTMQLKGVKVDAMDGKFELNSKIHFEKEPRVELFLDCDNIDIQKFLEQLDNFGQEVLTADNLRGRLKSLIKVNLFLDSLGNFKHDDLFVVADVRVENGELINLKLLEGFSGFIKMRDLQHIVFTELTNQFKIEHGKFILPAMFIQSNALNLVVGGEYGFNHDLDFKLKINAGQVIANKFKKYNPNKTAIKARQKGLFNIYAHIYGNLYENYSYKIGPKHSKRFLEAQLNQNLPALTNTLRAEFAKNTNKEANQPIIAPLAQPKEWEDIPEYEGENTEEEYIEGF
ncbi:AsmA-like C-terminal region-containing protein [Aureispira anguillae]|uniref:AsmA-like C-terminal region-containing protein n=1 Tax=Aureispira anguillae TaxID=2864201 RepID=A0A915YKU8_9BACT|nr:AsmA-like C-terminal region-containing protein [Aureispira anguillae]BDS15080.1 AsmA-like C-terminal region-containing protein [Aureispira anguillae]